MAPSLNSAHKAPVLTVRAQPILPFTLSFILFGLWLGQILGAYTLIGFNAKADNEVLTWALIPFCLFFFVDGLFHMSRRLTIQHSTLIIAHWFRQQQIPLEQIAALSIRYRRLGRSFIRLLEVWGHGAEPTSLASIDLANFSQASLRQLVERLQHECPELEVDREVVRYIGGIYTA